MPKSTYDYHCGECDYYFEERVEWEESRKVKCPKCETIAEKLPSAPPVFFKGGGWETNDGKNPHRDMDVAGVSGMSKVDTSQQTVLDQVLDKQDLLPTGKAHRKKTGVAPWRRK